MEKGNNLHFFFFCFVSVTQVVFATAFLFYFAMFAPARILCTVWNLENIHMLCSYPQSVFMCLQLCGVLDLGY